MCDVTGIRKCTLAFVYALRREERRGGQQAGSVKFSRLDLASRQCVKITWSLAAPSPRTTPSRASIAASLFCQRRTHSNAEERIRIRGRGFLLLLVEGAIECVSRGIDSRLFRVQRRMWSCYPWYERGAFGFGLLDFWKKSESLVVVGRVQLNRIEFRLVGESGSILISRNLEIS